MAEPNVCAKDRCGKVETPNEPLIQGWCEQHRWGTCETPGCGKRAVGRVALSEIETGDDGRLYRRFIGNPLACAECTDIKKRAAKVAQAEKKAA